MHCFDTNTWNRRGDNKISGMSWPQEKGLVGLLSIADWRHVRQDIYRARLNDTTMDERTSDMNHLSMRICQGMKTESPPRNSINRAVHSNECLPFPRLVKLSGSL